MAKLLNDKSEFTENEENHNIAKNDYDINIQNQKSNKDFVSMTFNNKDEHHSMDLLDKNNNNRR